jgi:hypothetical protein
LTNLLAWVGSISKAVGTNPQVTDHENFKQVLISDRLKAAIKRINLDDDGNSSKKNPSIPPLLLKNTFQEKGFITWDAAIASSWWMV